MSSTKTILFIGATGGCGRAALRHSLAAGHTCIALCRTPSKLTAVFPTESHANLKIVEGNAHDDAALSKALVSPSDNTRMVDVVVTSIGAALLVSKMGMDDRQVCEKGMKALLATITSLREKGVTGRPRIIAVSTTGASPFARDIPLAMIPVYATLVKHPLIDKRAMEGLLYASNEEGVVVRPSHLTNGTTEKTVRVGVEDPNAGIESAVIGYTISRDDVGKWIFDNLLQAGGDKYIGKAVSITY